MTDFPMTREQVHAIIENPEMLDGDDYQKLFDYYLNSGEMPYGTAKARTGDPDQWILMKLEDEFGMASAH